MQGRRFVTPSIVAASLIAAAPVAASPPATPIQVDVDLKAVPTRNGWVALTASVVSLEDAPGTEVAVVVEGPLAAERYAWTLDLEAGIPRRLETRVRATEGMGNATVSVRARCRVDDGTVWGDMKSVPVHVGRHEADHRRGWQVASVPVAAMVVRGDARIVSDEPTPLPFAREREATDAGSRPQPAVQPRHTVLGRDGASPDGASVTLTGRFRYEDRGGDDRDLDQQLLEVRTGSGAPLSPQQFCFTGVDGSFSCTVERPGTTLRVWARSWTNFNVPDGTNRLGVFSGPETEDGCGSDDIRCAYPVQTAEIDCSPGSTCDLGTWLIDQAVTGEPWLGAHQMTQDLIRAWKRLFFTPREPADSVPGPIRINYPVPVNHGTHAHVGAGVDGWISIEPPSQKAADVVVHEMGHIVMSNLWADFETQWPIFDCPSPHQMAFASGPGCALSEGFASFWAWYGNELYDGHAGTSDGPVFDWPSGAFADLERRRLGNFFEYDDGDEVEGNVAASMGDHHDAANDGPGFGATDRLTQGVALIWEAIATDGYDDFAEYWDAYRDVSGVDDCAALDALNLNTIDYRIRWCPRIEATMSRDTALVVAGERLTFDIEVVNETPGSFWIYRFPTLTHPGGDVELLASDDVCLPYAGQWMLLEGFETRHRACWWDVPENRLPGIYTFSARFEDLFGVLQARGDIAVEVIWVP